VLDGLYPKPLMLLDRMFLPLTGLAVVPSVFLKNVLVQGLKLRPGRVKVIANGIDLSRFGRARVADPAFKETLGVRRNDRLVGMVANLVEVKDHAVLLDAVPRILREVPGVRFLLIGDGPLREPLEAKARSLPRPFSRISGRRGPHPSPAELGRALFQSRGASDFPD
jgi:glycosyltransferase involved in cell wall biosynthesis